MQIDELPEIGLGTRRHYGLEKEQAPARRHRAPTAFQNARRLRIVPVVQHARQDVEIVPGGDRLEEAGGNDVDTVGQAGRFERRRSSATPWGGPNTMPRKAGLLLSTRASS